MHSMNKPCTACPVCKRKRTPPADIEKAARPITLSQHVSQTGRKTKKRVPGKP